MLDFASIVGEPVVSRAKVQSPPSPKHKAPKSHRATYKIHTNGTKTRMRERRSIKYTENPCTTRQGHCEWHPCVCVATPNTFMTMMMNRESARIDNDYRVRTSRVPNVSSTTPPPFFPCVSSVLQILRNIIYISYNCQ